MVLRNRLTKIDYAPSPDRKTEYFYDADPGNRDPNWPTNNNRLLWYTEWVGSERSGWTLTRTVRYTYYKIGHVSNITIKDVHPGVGDPNDYLWHRDLAFYYNTAGQLWRVLWDRWQVNGQGQFTDYERLAAREFHYDGLGQRYVSRDVDPNAADPEWWSPLSPWVMTDYAGELPYGDFELYVEPADPNDPNSAWVADVVEQTRYFEAWDLNGQQSAVDPNETRYFHGDLIDSTMLTTGPGGTAVSAVSYTAFGERVGDAGALGSRYQYAGGYGYESDLLWLEGAPGTAPLTFQHVGARWYEPGIARFLQRDPIAIYGGLNFYAYCAAEPAATVDPDGFTTYILGAPGAWDPMSGRFVAGDVIDNFWDLAKAIAWRVVAVIRNVSIPPTKTPVVTVPVTTCVVLVGGLDALGSGLHPILHYVRARNTAIRGDWDLYERQARQARDRF